MSFKPFKPSIFEVFITVFIYMFIPPIRNGDDLGVVYGSGFTTFDCATSVLPGTVYPWILVT